MSDTLALPAHAMARIHDVTSVRSRLVETTLAVLHNCRCEGPHTAGVLRGFGFTGRSEAAVLRRRLAQRGVRAKDVPVSVVVALWGRHDEERSPPCVLVDAATDPTPEAERAAALAGVPLVRARSQKRGEMGEADRTIRSELVAALHATSVERSGAEGETFPSVAGQIPDIALEELRVVPNQPEVGRIRLRVHGSMPLTLESGTELRCAPVAGALRIDATSPAAEPRTWLTSRAEVDQVEGLHTVHRDGLCVSDLSAMVIEPLSRGVARYVV